MRIAVLGGSGLVGAQVCSEAESRGHTVLALSRRSGIDVVAGVGLAAALVDVDAIIDTFSEPSSDPEKFRRAAENAQRAGAENGVGTYVLVSIVNVDDDRLAGVAHYRAKTAQEAMVRTGPIPSTVVRTTQWFDFAPMIMSRTTRGPVCAVPRVHCQPVASASVARVLVDTAEAGTTRPGFDLSGPEPMWLGQMVRLLLTRAGTRRIVLPVPFPGAARAMASGVMLAPTGAMIDTARFEDWRPEPSPAG